MERIAILDLGDERQICDTPRVANGVKNIDTDYMTQNGKNQVFSTFLFFIYLFILVAIRT